MAVVMTNTFIDVVANTLAEIKAEIKTLLHGLGDTIAEVEAETLYKTLSNIKAKTLVEVLHDTLAKKGRQNNW